jgi:RHS repeat-associated protein
MESTQIQALYEPPLAAMPQLSEKPRQGFETKKTAWNPGPSVYNSTAAIGLRAGLALECVRETRQTGLYYMPARYYSPALGRFLQSDPVGVRGGLNLYAYAGNDPVNSEDSTGQSPDGGGLTVTLSESVAGFFGPSLIVAATAYVNTGIRSLRRTPLGHSAVNTFNTKREVTYRVTLATRPATLDLVSMETSNPA